MSVRYEEIDGRLLLQYEKLFFGEVCGLDVSDRDSLSIPLDSPLNRLHFACVQDTVERLTADWGGNLSKFQWRNCIFIPIDRHAKPNDIYEEVYESLRHEYPSLFIRSYVYVIFIKVYGSSTLALDVPSVTPSRDDLQIYAWNTNYEVKLQGKKDLFNLQNKQGVDASAKVFVVSDPGRELRRIQDANSDVIDAVRAYLGELDLISQTKEKLEEVESALDARQGSAVLVEGPARSGKTIIAMSLLARYPESKMLLMNWYFYDALQDAFKIWSKFDDEKIRKLFSTDDETLDIVRAKRAEMEELERFRDEPQLLEREILMWELPSHKMANCPCWHNYGSEKVPVWRVTGIHANRTKEGDYIFVYKSGRRELNLMRVTKIYPENNSASAEYAYTGIQRALHARVAEDEERNTDELQRLMDVREAIDNSRVDRLIAETIREIAKALAKGGQRFFHHHRRHEEGLWVDDEHILIDDSVLLICDEAQRLGNYCGLDEVKELSKRKGSLFLCGDDCQRLNKKGDLGIRRLMDARQGFSTFTLPESVGIPEEIAALVRSLLGEGQAPHVRSDFEVGLVHDDAALISAFAGDPSGKKHYAIPNSTGFYRREFVPGVRKALGPTQFCTEDCDDYCIHRFIPMLPRDISEKKYKFFCSEAIMPSYALSAYELISREVESIYLKIPRSINKYTLLAPLETGDARGSWIKRHLYVLMTRATHRLVIEVEDEALFESFRRTLAQAGVSSCV